MGGPYTGAMLVTPLLLRTLCEVTEKGAFQLLLYRGLMRVGREEGPDLHTKGENWFPWKYFVAIFYVCFSK